MNYHISKFQQQGFLILMICSAIMLGIGIYMFVADSYSTSIVTSWRFNPTERTISWQTPVFGAIVMLILGILIKIDKPKLPKMNIQDKRTFVFEKITDYLKENDFKKRGNHFYKSNGSIGYCVNIQNDKWNDAEQIRFTLNVGIFTEAFWLECEDFKNTGIIPTFPKEYECAIRKRIGGLLPVKEDKWYCITSSTDVMKLWNEIERDLTEYILPFFTRYNTESDVIPNQFIYRKGGKQ
ncbi:DUF4304 domain-containing protein [Muribaculum intestinale]|uniref:DUF4304 domain-containing protein n=2 Tax=Muribaculum intestinale TaxID=1796646 RepID=UPI000F4A0B5E|nr:DUF4304 domain-containing protein [Muribaculum intestinale]ROT10672.1 DUF4304 domain-containing protein [Muribaculaceae bacterium Isolate-100 (HZI)]RXE66654.1 DUF4304 domain-containing protein [Muribaculaceae bacterium Isolate-007 (NCI)]